MSPSPPPDPSAWRRNSPPPRRPGPRRPRRGARFWFKALALAFVLFLGFGALLEAVSPDEEKPADTPVRAVEDPPRTAETKGTPETPGTVETTEVAEVAETTATTGTTGAAEAPETSRAAGAAEPPGTTGTTETTGTTGTTGTPDPPRTPASRTAVVTRVIDGDTVEVRGRGAVVPAGAVTRVRLLEIDTPEKGECFAREATARTRVLLPPGSTVRLERDDELKDRYGRHLLYLWNEDGVFVNEALVRGGHARSVLYQPNDKYWSRISRAQSAARSAGAGLWGSCPATPAVRPTTAAPPTTAPTTAAPPTAAPTTPAAPAPRRTTPGLPPGPPAGVPDVDCSDLPGPVWVGSDDPHRLDRDGDGIGCDSS
ncbi:thermonuclease family protein [Streptomyces filamentosus]|uniref:thermonuclease family protein n=1 Tax=Streptomyces filamentosus TaxID=67294 RepID=UPI00380B0F08